MIDIHCHMLFGVDDGPADIKESLELLVQAKEYGVDTIILTPHYRHGMFAYQKRDVDKNYYELCEYAERLGIKLLLGCEYHVNSHMVENFDNRRIRTMANSNYILTEYKNECDYSYILTQTTEAIASGYIPIIAHAERYDCMQKKPERAGELKRLGAYIQINADSIIGNDGWTTKRYCQKLIKHGWVDFVASDTHGIKNRPNRLKDAYDYCTDKFGTATAEKLFSRNAADMLEAQVQNFQTSVLNLFHVDDKNYDAVNYAKPEDFPGTITVSGAIRRAAQKEEPEELPVIEKVTLENYDDFPDMADITIELPSKKTGDTISLPEDIDLPPVKKNKKPDVIFPDFEDDVRIVKKKRR